LLYFRFVAVFFISYFYCFTCFLVVWNFVMVVDLLQYNYVECSEYFLIFYILKI
jgi:hypothetical protein